jgi:hypothetical protein
MFVKPEPSPLILVTAMSEGNIELLIKPDEILLAFICVNPDPFPIKFIARILPSTSNFSVG